MHKWWLRRSGPCLDCPLPLLVIGSLRMGGGGKTPVTALVAKALAEQGLRVGILSYGIHGYDPRSPRKVMSNSSWKDSSEEAVWLKRTTSLPVWVTRDRPGAWQWLSQHGGIDVLVSDDGLEDPRLEQASRILLDWGDRASSIDDLFPVGRCRSLRQDHGNVLVWSIGDAQAIGTDIRYSIEPILNAQGKQAPLRAGVLVCAIGDPCRLERDLAGVGVALRKVYPLRDHSLNVDRVVRHLLHCGEDIVFVTEKDAEKLGMDLASHPNIFRIRQRFEAHPGLRTPLFDIALHN